MNKGTVTSDDPVNVKLTNGTLTADRLRISEGGAVVRFEGNVVMNIDHLDDGNGPTQSANATSATTTSANAAPAESAQPSNPQPARTRSPTKSANPK
jgi:lipopolysaccharide export system protein LptC